MVADQQLEERVHEYRSTIDKAQQQVQRVIVGNDALIQDLLACIFCAGHALIEGVPGLGKTQLIRALADTGGLTTRRVQFTPDLMPADIIGTNTLFQDETGVQDIRFQAGPLFTQVLLADEINRAAPKTQSALLEAMQEQQVTVGGVTYRLDRPFVVLATQNPLELEGTYPLPEAQLDRFFFKLTVDYPTPQQLAQIIDRTTGAIHTSASPVLSAETIAEIAELVLHLPIAPEVVRYAVDVVYATHPDRGESPQVVRDYVRYGSSPRGAQSLILAGRFYALLDGRVFVAPEDVRRAIAPSLRHRIILNFRGEAEGVTVEQIVEAVQEAVPGP